ncbi:MAG: hypothetical protein HY088_05240 [Ignavibacteriales bacterium]|nr:hypothetical protein [Ignavibacteriales bacterium]
MNSNLDVGTTRSAYQYERIFITHTYVEEFLFNPSYVPKKTVYFQPSVNIEGIPFSVSETEGLFVLSNSQWPSLSSSGSSLFEAMGNAAQLVAEVCDEYIYESDENLSEDAKEFRKFLLSRALNK